MFSHRQICVLFSDFVFLIDENYKMLKIFTNNIDSSVFLKKKMFLRGFCLLISIIGINHPLGNSVISPCSVYLPAVTSMILLYRTRIISPQPKMLKITTDEWQYVDTKSVAFQFP